MLKSATRVIINLFITICLMSLLPQSAISASSTEINAKSDAVISQLYEKVGEAKALSRKAIGILIFPSVIKAGFGIGGEYGEGALRIKGKTVDYYNTAAASIGFQLGAQSKSVILMFMKQKALNDFRHSDGWEIGVDGSVAIATFGAGGSLDSHNLREPIIGFIINNKGLMYNLTLEGSKITKINKNPS
jgi:lipid-binding SYLF domain-containing protein